MRFHVPLMGCSRNSANTYLTKTLVFAATEAATQNISSIEAKSKTPRQCKGIAWRECLEDVKLITKAPYPVDFWSACSPWSIVKAQLTAACDTQRQFLSGLMHTASPSGSIDDCSCVNSVKRREQYLTAAVSILSALGMDTKALHKIPASESDTSATARRIAILQAVLESIEIGVPVVTPSHSSAHESSFHAVSASTDAAPGKAPPQTLAHPDCDEEGHDLSPVLFSANGSRMAQSRNASASEHVDSYVSFLDALDEDGDDTGGAPCQKPVYGSLQSRETQKVAFRPGKKVPSRAGDVSTPSPPASDEETSHSISYIQTDNLLCSAGGSNGAKPLTLFTSLSSSADGICSSNDRQLSPRALRVGQV